MRVGSNKIRSDVALWLARAIHDWEKKIDVYPKDSSPTIACKYRPGGLG
jgi:hypothetical protein